MRRRANRTARVAVAAILASLAICTVLATGSATKPASAAGSYMINACADGNWLDWAKPLETAGVDWLISGVCKAGATDIVEFYTPADLMDTEYEWAWIYPDTRGSIRTGLTITDADVVLSGNNGSDAGALQGVRFCGASCGDLVTLSQPEVQHDSPEQTVLSSGDGRLPPDSIEMRFVGHCTSLPCGPTQPLRVGKIWLTFQDDLLPVSSASSIGPGGQSPIDLGWIGQPFDFRWQAEDLGSGVARVTLAREGTQTPAKIPNLGASCIGFAYAGLCPQRRQAQETINPSDAIWQEGLNKVFVDVEDRAGNQSARPTVPHLSFHVDRRNPTPAGLAVPEATDSGWVPDPAITLAWTNEGESGEVRSQPDPHSGVVAAEYDFQPRDGQPDPPAQRINGSAISSASVSIPSPGGWDIVVRTIDAVGNRSAPMTRFVGLDDAAPDSPSVDPIPWVGSVQLLDGQPFTWVKPTPTRSGICGYAHSVDGSVDSEAPAAMSISGDVTQGVLPSGNVEGVRYLHLRAISCAGVPGQTAHRRFEIDLVPPRTQANLPDGSWTDNPFALRVAATDDGSGVQEIQMKIAGSTVVFTGAEAAPELPEGSNVIEFKARDVAGNVSQPESLTIGVDRSAPVGWFERPSTDRPTLLGVVVADSLSGISRGTIDYRPAGGAGEWTELETRSEQAVGIDSAAKLTARFPDESRPDGAYELRARAADRVGNVGEITFGLDGSPATVVTPLRKPTTLTLAFEDRRSSRCTKRPAGGCKPKLTKKSKLVDFGLGAMTAGRLVDSKGDPIPGQPVQLFEQRTGSSDRRKFSTVRTDSDGRFRVHVKPGVNRRIIARFDRHELLRTAEGSVLIFTRSKLTLKASSERVRRGGHLVVRGRLYTGGEKIVLGRPIYVLAVGTSWSVPVSVGQGGVFRKIVPTGRRGFPLRLSLQARIPVQDGWPYYAGRSRVVKVTIVP